MKVKKQIITFVFIFVFTLLFGCRIFTNTFERDEYNRVVPKYSTWSFKKSKNPDPNHVLNYDVVYFYKDTRKVPAVWKTIRFWKDGQIMLGWVDNMLDPEEVNSFNDTSIGYFKVDENNNIMAQIYWSLNFGQYAYIRYKLDQNKNLRQETWWVSWWDVQHKSKLKNPPIYKPIKFIRKPQQPDW